MFEHRTGAHCMPPATAEAAGLVALPAVVAASVGVVEGAAPYGALALPPQRVAIGPGGAVFAIRAASGGAGTFSARGGGVLSSSSDAGVGTHTWSTGRSASASVVPTRAAYALCQTPGCLKLSRGVARMCVRHGGECSE